MFFQYSQYSVLRLSSWERWPFWQNNVSLILHDKNCKLQHLQTITSRQTKITVNWTPSLLMRLCIRMTIREIAHNDSHTNIMQPRLTALDCV